ncbi:MAG: hypothetical protein CL466_12005 [Acidimicrobiaceae bacterium]|nr:hypothetical protein [Acidimicrobiaceae bacterium]
MVVPLVVLVVERRVHAELLAVDGRAAIAFDAPADAVVAGHLVGPVEEAPHRVPAVAQNLVLAQSWENSTWSRTVAVGSTSTGARASPDRASRASPATPPTAAMVAARST